MAAIFSKFLFFATLITGIVWLLEKLVFAKKRQAKLEGIEAQTENGLDSATLEQLKKQPWWIENSVSIFPVIAFVLVLRSFLYEPFQIPSGSMMPTLLVGDFILVEKYAYGLKDPVWRTELVETGKPERGDIVVFKYPPNPSLDYIKRVVGLPGDKIHYSKDKQLCIQPMGESACTKIELSNAEKSEFLANGGIPQIQMDEKLGDVEHKVLFNPMVRNREQMYFPRPGTTEWVVPKGHYFAMGDNRDNSSDSRYWGFVPEANLVGKAVAIWTSFEFDHDADSILPSWIPTGVRFERIGGIH
ncbi:signal peptidase I [Vibrio sagamiensis]|uniref:Signal peptidase I n=1 Tax=Vibrio sagamiensis NBRC 104589 TaxID=1219064 RepID=A0A511QGR3_9VIBR|nr:signal peptidase I [Vibrio sagamiensis]PNQ70399.1 signal peptidase I [Vibrio agarivorans]GEM76461.1 signal peptidase I [Vibrio sagamiensis NBRC 104589]